MEKIPFSVAMCVYKGDKAEWFDEALASVINQTVVPDEIVLVVDGPVPESIDDVIGKYEGIFENFNVVRLHQNVGHGIARRVGMERCKHNLVALMDSDDISVADRFEQQLEIFFKMPEVSAVGGNIEEFIDTVDNVVAKRNVPKDDADIKEYLKKRCPFNQMTVLLKKEEVLKAGGYVDWYCDEDYYLWIRMYENNCVFANTGTTLVNVRVGKEMYQRRGGIKYFESEAKLQKYMYDKKIIGFATFISNVTKRFIVQLLLPNKIRGFVFQKFARER
ncbi:MAG: glycosyltransferase [Ruminococcaceae bacterium]|nr:glycosyltransferase [Oscillospiraceae bacterium]